MSKTDFEPEICECCTQTKEVLYPIDKGTTDIVRAIAARIRKKGINVVHLRKEMEVHAKEFTIDRMLIEGVLTSNHIGNATRPRKHGLIAFAKVDGEKESGNYLLTSKGAKFLRGEPVPRYAIQDKVTGHIKGYWKPEEYTITIDEILKKDDYYWDGIDFDIVGGRIVKDLPKNKDGQHTFGW